MNERFAQKVVLVAGGTGGLGRAVSQALLAEGAVTIVTFRTQAEFDTLARDAGTSAERLRGSRVDVTDAEAAQRLIEGVAKEHGRLDGLVNAVGGYAGGAKLWSAEANVLEHMLALNLLSGYALARAAVPVMVNQGSGAIVNVAAKAALEHPAGAAAYAASKAAAIALMDSLAAELKGTGVRVNSILPSVIDTDANRKAMPKADFAKWPKPLELARVILFLLSDEAKVVHGASIPVYGAG